MGCTSSTQVTSIDKREKRPDHGHSFEGLFRSEMRKNAVRKNAGRKAVNTTVLSHVMPHEAPDSEPAELWVADLEDFDGSDTDSFSTASVQVHVPAHLQQDIKEEPILTDFREPTEVECSWDMPSMRERAKDVPRGFCFAPDREMHDEHRQRLEGYLKMIARKPHRFEAHVHMKKMLSGMGPVGIDHVQH